MKKQLEKSSKKIGLSPGSLVYVGERKVEEIKIQVTDYSEKQHEVRTVDSIEETFPYKDSPTITWINIDGLHDVEILKTIGSHFNIDALVVEDILNTQQRPKIEIFEDYIFIVLKMTQYDDKSRQLDVEQVSFIIGKRFVITFQEIEGDVFDPVRARLQNGTGRLRKRGADYLAYALMDVIVDHYFLIIEKLEERIESLEEGILSSADQSLVQEIHLIKRELIFLHKAIWPVREVVGLLQREESPLIEKSTFPFLRDLYDHTIQVIDTIESYREMVSGILDVYLSTMSNKMNEVMKVLTIIATIFIPLSFLAGIYGMNFDTTISPFNMPELGSRYGYIFFWITTIAIGGGLLLFFRKKKWL